MKKYVLALLAALPLAAGCRQRMADQPYYRPLEQSEFFPDGRASRPLERGTVHRGQYLEADPLATGLTAEEWGRSYQYAVPAQVDAGAVEGEEKIRRAVGSPRYDQRQAGQPKAYVEEFPFAITQADLKRGQERYTIFCAACHGPLGNGQGKIWERGYLAPTSFHTQKVTPTEVDLKNPAERLGYSRGYKLWGHDVPMTDVPHGYIFEVITRGYGGMPSYSAQVPPPDRWRIVAYVRALQFTQHAPAKQADAAGGKK
jgi:mono/diheme cytochrome c family protein